MQPLVDLESSVEIGVVDQPLPADSGARFFEIDAHDDMQVTFQLVTQCFQLAGILHRSLGIVNGAGANDNDNAIIRAVQDVVNRLARIVNRLCSRFRDRKGIMHLGGCCHLLDALDAQVVGLVHGHCRGQSLFVWI